VFEKILLTLDGSQSSEVAIPYVEYLAGKMDSEVVLLHVHSESEPNAHLHQFYLSRTADAMKLRMKKRWNRKAGPRVRPEILTGEPAEVIHNYIMRSAIDMVAMATHGSSGIKLWLLGSVADKIVRTANTPVLLVRSKSPPPETGKVKLVRRILLPLDGSDASRVAVPYALALAKKLEAGITLFRMAEKASYLMAHVVPYSRRRMEDYDWIDAVAVRESRSHLRGVKEQIRREGVPVTHIITLGADPAYEILQQERKVNADLVVMATRGKSQVEMWGLGSVAEKVLRQGDLPLLLVREPAG